MIIRLATARNSTILIDSPEAFLQTKMQSSIADYVIECSENGNNVMLETSSEYLLFRIRRRIAEKKISPSDVYLLYIDSGDENDAKCEYIEISEKGKIDRKSEGVNGFFSTNFEDMNMIMLGGKLSD